MYNLFVKVAHEKDLFWMLRDDLEPHEASRIKRGIPQRRRIKNSRTAAGLVSWNFSGFQRCPSPRVPYM